MMILVLGGTGFVGGHLLARVTQMSSPTRWAVHSPRKRDLMTRLPVETVNVDVRDYASLLAALHGVTAVINLVTVTRELSPSDFAAVHYDGMLNLVQAAKEAGVRRIIHVGAPGDNLARQDPKKVTCTGSSAPPTIYG